MYQSKCHYCHRWTWATTTRLKTLNHHLVEGGLFTENVEVCLPCWDPDQDTLPYTFSEVPHGDMENPNGSTPHGPQPGPWDNFDL